MCMSSGQPSNSFIARAGDRFGPDTSPKAPPPPAPIVDRATPLARKARTASKKRQGRNALRLKRTSANSATNSASSGSGVNA